MYKTITLKRGKEESLKRFHPWVFSGAIMRLEEGIDEGEVVRVLTEKGDFIAVGHYQVGSIAVRVLSFNDIEINYDFFAKRLKAALDMRLSIGVADNPANNTSSFIPMMLTTPFSMTRQA